MVWHSLCQMVEVASPLVARRTAARSKIATPDADELRTTMGRRVRTARRVLDLSQVELAAAFDKTHGWLGSIEAGKAFPPPFLIWTLQRASRIPHAWFFGEGPDLPTATTSE